MNLVRKAAEIKHCTFALLYAATAALLISLSGNSFAQLSIEPVGVSATSTLQKASFAADADQKTRWESLHGVESAQLTFDLGASYKLTNITIDWEAANAKTYLVEGSDNQASWTTLASVNNGLFGHRTDDLKISGQYRYLRINAKQRSDGNQWGYSIWEVNISGSDNSPDVPADTPVAIAFPPPAEAPETLPSVPLSYTPLFDQTYPAAETPNWYRQPDGTIVTFGSGRGRSRHESENSFYTFPANYFEHRTFGFEIHDNIANGESQIAIYYEPEFAHFQKPECRSAYSNLWRADFNNNGTFEPMKVAEHDSSGRGEKWVCYINRDAHDGDDGKLEVGEWMEVEFQQFLGRFDGDPEIEGQNIYYTDTYRFKIGEPGIYIVTDDELEAKIRTGGDATAPFVNAGTVVETRDVVSSTPTTITYTDSSGDRVTNPILDGIGTYSTYVVDDEAAVRTSFFREALNIRMDTHNDFLNGRRIFHTRFDTGQHVEPGNPDLSLAAGLSSDLTASQSCVDCHVNNGRGRALTGSVPAPSTVVKLSSGHLDSQGQPQPHSYFGSLLHSSSNNSNIPAEGTLGISSVNINGSFSDGRTYQLVKPEYNLNIADSNGGSAPYFSPRMPQTITGLGLLEAIDDDDITAKHDPDDDDRDGISGRASVVTDPVSGDQKIGRFGWKSSHASLMSFTASALNQDIGVNTSVLPSADCGNFQTDCIRFSTQGIELPDTELNELVVYLQALGAPSRRPDEVTSSDVDAGEKIFENLNCATCHTPSMKTAYRHPLAELRGQTIRPYTDLLLHDMGSDLADKLTASEEYNREWRTPPLWGLGLTENVNGEVRLLHDGRARSVEEAILWHGGEAQTSSDSYKRLSLSQRRQLLSFLNSL